MTIRLSVEQPVAGRHVDAPHVPLVLPRFQFFNEIGPRYYASVELHLIGEVVAVVCPFWELTLQSDSYIYLFIPVSKILVALGPSHSISSILLVKSALRINNCHLL